MARKYPINPTPEELATIVIIQTSSCSIIEESTDIIPQTVLGSVLSEVDITQNILSSMQESLGMDLNQYYSYGKTYYEGGLPDGTTGTYPVDQGIVKAEIEERIGTPIYLIDSFYHQPIAHFFTLQHLIDVHGYDRNTGQVETQLNLDAYPDSDVGDAAQICPTYVYDVVWTDYNTGSFNVRLCSAIEWFFTGETTEHYLEYLIQDYPGSLGYKVYPDHLYTQASYWKVNEMGQANPRVYTWIYDMNTGTIPELPYPDLNNKVGFYPIIPFRIQNDDYGSEAHVDTPLYETSCDLLRTIGMEFEDIREAINENPDIDEIDNVYFLLGVMASNTNQEALRYLFNFFERAYQLYPSSFGRWKGVEAINDSIQNLQGEIESGIYLDAPTPSLLNIDFMYYSVHVEMLYLQSFVRTGYKCPVGTYMQTHDTEPSRKTWTYWSSPDMPPEVMVDVDVTKFHLFHQVDNDTYVELEICGAVNKNFVYDRYYVETDIYEAFNGADEDGDGIPDSCNFVIPLRKALMSNISILEQTRLAEKSIILTFNAYEIIHLKWYQSAFFFGLVKVVSIFISVFSFDLIKFTDNIVVAMASGIKNVASALFQATIMHVGAKFALNYVAEKSGVGAALAASMMGMWAIESPMFKKAFPWLPIGGLSLPESYLITSNLALKRSVGIEAKKAASEAVSDVRAMREMYKEEQKKIREAYDDLRWDVAMNHAVLQSVYGGDDTVNGYYDRLIHQGNPGAASLDTISNYHDNALSLPQKFI